MASIKNQKSDPISLTVSSKHKENQITIKKNKRVALLGLNGSGKTTFIRQLVGEINNTKSKPEYNIDQQKLAVNSLNFKEQMGYQADTMLSLSKLTVFEYLNLCAELKGITQQQFILRLPQLVEQWQLDNIINQPLERLSKGNMQKACIAQVFVNQPQFLFFDEPCQSLDPIEQELFNKNIANLTDFSLCLFSTHNASHALSVADDIIIFHQFKIAYFFEERISENFLLFSFTAQKEIEELLTLSGIDYKNLKSGLFKLLVSRNKKQDNQSIEMILEFKQKHHDIIEFCLPEKKALMPLFRLIASNEWTAC